MKLEAWSQGATGQQELNTFCICACMPVELCSRAAGAQHSVLDVVCQDGDSSLEKDVEYVCMCVCVQGSVWI